MKAYQGLLPSQQKIKTVSRDFTPYTALNTISFKFHECAKHETFTAKYPQESCHKKAVRGI